MTACPACSWSNPEAAKFCNQCGARLEAAAATPRRQAYTPRHLVDRVLRDRAALQGERKLVTVLFADIKGSTRLAEQAGAENWHDILDRFFALLGEAIHRFEGTINQYTGDGVMALFGAPVAHEDHAQRACHAALEMQSKIRGFADALRLEQGLNLTLRVGINTGEVIVGRIGDDLRMDYTAQGVTVNLASRLEHICEPGQVYVSRSTAALVRGEVSLRDLGATKIHGVDDPIPVFAVVGSQGEDARLAYRMSRGGGHFVGRETELAKLQSVLASASQGQGKVLALTGVAGIGKSRLCHEFLSFVRSRGVIVHQSSASPYSQHRTLSVARRLYLSRLGIERGAEPEWIRQRVTESLPEEIRERPGAIAFACQFAGLSHTPDVPPDVALGLREPMTQALAEILPASSRTQVLVIEDVQHVDQNTLDFIQRLSQAVRNSHSVLLLSWRPDEMPPSLPQLDETIALQPLSNADTHRLALDWLGESPELAPLAERLSQRSAGNPYFIEEAVTTLSESGHIGGSVGAYRLLEQVDKLPIPDTIHALIASRIDRLDPAQKQLIHAASVVGVQFESALVEGLLEPEAIGVEGVNNGLTALQAAGFVANEEQGQWRFSLPLVREVAYGSQLESSRTRAHAELAKLLINHSEQVQLGERARTIAAHWAMAGHWRQAGEWNLAAGQWFGTRDARIMKEQIELGLRHLDQAENAPDLSALKVVARAAMIRVAQLVQIPREEVVGYYEEGRKLAADSGDCASEAELMIAFGNARLQWGDAPSAVELITSGLRRCPKDTRADLAARFRLSILLAFASAGRGHEGLQRLNDAAGRDWLDGPINSDNTLSRGFVSVQRAWAGELPQARSDLAGAIETAEHDGRSVSWMYGLQVDLAWFDGNHDQALSASERALELSDAYGSPYFQVLAQRARGQALILSGQGQAAVEMLERATELTTSRGDAGQFEAHTLAVLAEACQSIGEVRRAAEVFARAIESASLSGAKLWELRVWLGRLALPTDALPQDAFESGLARAESLIEEMNARGVAPRLLEIKSLRASSAQQRTQFLEQARQSYLAIGAEGHARRLAAV